VADLVKQILYLEIEDARNQIRSVGCLLTWSQLVLNLNLLGVSSKGYE